MKSEKQIKEMEKVLQGLGFDPESIKKLIPNNTPAYNHLYNLEHKFIPASFYIKQQQFIDELLTDKNVLFNALDETLKKINYENPYKASDFSVEKLNVSGDTNIVKLNLPQPNGPAEDALCKHIFLFYENDWSNQMLYCVESNSMAKTENEVFICGWNKFCQHCNYGPSVLTENNDGLSRCQEIYEKNKTPATIFAPKNHH